MTKKMKALIFGGLALGAMAIAGASVLGVDEFLKLFDGMSAIIGIETTED